MGQEYFDDDSLRDALLRAEAIKLEGIPSEDELNHRFSRKFQNKMKKLIKEQRRTSSRKKAYSKISKAAAIVLIIAGVGLGMTLGVDAYRERLVNFIVEIYHDLTLLRRDGDTDLGMDGTAFVEPDGIPERFTLYERDSSDLSLDIFYITEKNEALSYHQTSNQVTSTTMLDTEDADIYYIEMAGEDIMVVEKGNHMMYFWENESFSYLISGYVTREEIDKMAESIIIRK